MNASTLLRAYAALEDVTPMLYDCGLLCGAACCRADADGQGGVYLFPSEETLILPCAWAHVEQTDFAPMLVCDGACERSRRPLGCRIFPLTPVRGRNGSWTVRMDARARAMCPLAASGLRGLDPAFVRAARDALRIIADDGEGDAFLRKWLRLEEAFRQPLF